MAEPLIRLWRKDEMWKRCHDKRHTTTAFNRSGTGDARFSPLHTSTGALIPTLYAGSTDECVRMETLFHALPTDLDGFIFDLDDLASAVMSGVAPTRDLRLIELTTVGLRRFKLKKSEVIETGPLIYPNTRSLAQDWHRHHPDVDGLLWVSRQYDESMACVLFGDRVKSAELKAVKLAESVFEPHILSAMLRLGTRLGIEKIYTAGSGVATFAELMNHARIL